MPNVPWFPPSHRPTKNAPNHIPQQQMLNQYASSSSRKHGLPSNSESSPTPKIRKYTHSFPKPSQEMQFTPGELAAKRQAAIEEEAMKKVIKDEIARKKQEEKWIELGKAVCSVTPEDIGLFDHPKIKHPVDCNGDEVIAIVANFTNNLKKLIGVDAKGTILGNTNGLAAALCSVHHKATFNIEQKVLRFRQVREELAQREKETQARLDDRWIEIGKAICSFTLDDFKLTDPKVLSNTSKSSLKDQSEANSIDVASDEPTTSVPNPLNCREKQSSNDSDASDDEYGDVDDFEIKQVRKRKKRSKKTLAWRGEDVIENVFNFTVGITQMMGEHHKQTCLRSPYEFTSVFCNVAEKSVRDRHTVKRIDK